MPSRSTLFSFACSLLFAFPVLADDSTTEVSVRTGTLLGPEDSFVTLGVGLRLHTESAWVIEAAADLSLAELTPLAETGFLQNIPLSLTGLFDPLPDWTISPFVQFGGGLNLRSNTEPEPFLHGGGGAAYQRETWGIATDVKVLFLPGSNVSSILDERSLQVNLSLHHDF